VARSILVVDDDPHIRDVMRSAFEKTGMAISIAQDGLDALRARICDSFFTTRRDSGGTGMGAMLDARGGAIRLIDSEVGTAFELTIPVADTAMSG
jgi:hypothetical protein